MPKLREYYLSLSQEPSRLLAQPQLNFQDPNVSAKELLDQIQAIQIAKYRRSAFRRMLSRAVAQLPEQTLRDVYQRLKKPGEEYRGTWESFYRNLRKDPPIALTNPNFFGSTEEEIIDAYEQALGPERVDALIAQPLPSHPLSPDFQGSRVHRPYQPKLDGLIQQHTHGPDQQKNEENRKLLEQAGEILEDVRPELLDAIHKTFKDDIGPGYVDGEKISNDRLDVLREQGFTLLADGQYADLIQHGTNLAGSPYYEILVDNFSHPLSPQETEALHQLGTQEASGLSQEAKDVLRSVVKDMDELDYSVAGTKPLAESGFPSRRPTQPGEVKYNSEQGVKYYAFWPVAAAKNRLINAVNAGDLEKIRGAVEDYRRAEKVTDRMMETLRSEKCSQDPTYSANVESTRSDTGQIPEKYAVDYHNQNKLNSLSLAYLSLKNADMTMEELINDPVAAGRKLGERYLEGSGLDSRSESIGASLQFGMKHAEGLSPSQGLITGWSGQVSGLNRGLAGIAGVEKDPARRAQFLAKVQLGFMEATMKVREEAQLYDTMERVANGNRPQDLELRGLLYQHAAVLPEAGAGRFNQRALMEAFARGERPDPLQTLAGQPVDYAALAERNKKILEDAAREEQISGSFETRFDPDEYLLNAFSAQSRLLAQAPPEARQSQGYAQLKDSLETLWRRAKDPKAKALLQLGGELLRDPEALSFLQTGKQDQISSSDTREYTRMKQSLGKLQEARRILLEGKGSEIHKLYHTDFTKDVEQAKKDAFTYVRLKYKNGKKTSFHYESGERRAREGLELFRKLGEMQDALGQRSPAQKLLDEARLELLQHRHDDRWLRNEGASVLGVMLHAQSCIDAGIPAEVQNREGFRQKALASGQQLGSKLRDWNLADLIGLTDAALEDKGRFRQMAANRGRQLKAQYDRAVAPSLLKQARADLRKGFALDLAAEELGIESAFECFHEKNQLLQDKAKEILQRPDFLEATHRLMKDKTVEELRRMHKPAKPEGHPHAERDFYRHVNIINYEKRCAEIAAEAMLKHQGVEAPTRERLNQTAQALRRDESFRRFVQEKTAPMDTVDISKAANRLSIPEERAAVLDELTDRVVNPPQAGQAQPQAPQQGHDREHVPGGPVVGGG